MDQPQSFPQKLLQISASPDSSSRAELVSIHSQRKDRGSKAVPWRSPLQERGKDIRKALWGCICVGGVCSCSDIQHLEALFQRRLVQKYTQGGTCLKLKLFKKRGQRWCSQSWNEKEIFWEQRHHYLNRCNIWWLEAEANSWLNEKCNLIREANSKFIWRWGDSYVLEVLQELNYETVSGHGYSGWFSLFAGLHVGAGDHNSCFCWETCTGVFFYGTTTLWRRLWVSMALERALLPSRECNLNVHWRTMKVPCWQCLIY